MKPQFCPWCGREQTMKENDIRTSHYKSDIGTVLYDFNWICTSCKGTMKSAYVVS